MGEWVVTRIGLLHQCTCVHIPSHILVTIRSPCQEDAMQIIQANEHERASELEDLANEARDNFKLKLAERGGN